ncbi:MAG: sigma-70 family RNA polymerase sigma factor [Bacteroidetes bacterium]|nr:sigma-70 family RNA polymerase sigma factor [Bacteroidota bacterium]
MVSHNNNWYLEHLEKGSSTCMETLQRECYPAIARFVKTHGGSEQDAEDVFMDGVVAVYRKLKKGPVHLSCKFSVFLFQICKNLWYKKTRRKKFQSDIAVEDTEQIVISDDWIPAMEKTARMGLMQEKFLELPQSCQDLLDLCWHSELSLQDIAKKMGIEYGTARKRKHDCKKKLTTLVKADPRYEELL